MAGIRCSLLIGREREAAELSELVGRAAAGRGGSAFLVGEAGIGKSRLLAATAEVARDQGMVVLQGRVSPSPVPTPYRPFAEALAAGLRGRDLDGDRSLARFRSALAMLAPGRFDADPEPGPGANPSIVLLGEATIALLERCAEGRGAVLLLEDLQWAGEETCELIDYLSDKLDELAIAMVATVRTGEGSAAERMVRAVDARRGSLVRSLAPLDAPEVDALIGASLGMRVVPPNVRDVVSSASRGVPLLIEDILATLVDRGALQQRGDEWSVVGSLSTLVPANFSALVRDRLDALDPRTVEVLRAAAVLCVRFDWTLLPDVTALERDVVLACLRRGVDAQLVEEAPGPDPDRFRFRHGLSRAAVLETVTEGDAAAIASRALAILDASGRPLEGARLELMADLAVIAADRARAARLLVEASRQAIDQGACTSAQSFAEDAVAQSADTDTELLAREALVAACVAAGDSKRTAEVGGALLADLRRLGAGADRVAAVALQLAAAAIDATDWTTASAWVEVALAASPPTSIDGGRFDVLRASIALGQHDPVAATDHARRALAAGEALGDPALIVEALGLLGRAHRVTDVRAAAEVFRRAVAVAERAGSDLLLARAEAELGTIDVLLAGPPDALRRARRLAVKGGSVALAAMADYHLAIVHWLRFELELCGQAAERAVAAAARYELGLTLPAAQVMVGALAAVCGRRDEATAAFDAMVGRMDVEIEATTRGHALALAALACEDRDGARRELDHAAALSPPFSDVARAPFSGMRALVLAIAEDPAAAEVVAALCGDDAVVGVPRWLAELGGAVLAGRAGDGTGAAATCAAVLGQLAVAPWFCAMARRLMGEAASRDGWGDPAAWLGAAQMWFEGAGIAAPAAACKALLDAGADGAGPAPATADQPAGVSRREAEVLALVAEGLSNRDIAERLYLSVRTVEKHVERLLAKTGSANRAQLVALALRPGAAT